MVLLVAVMGGRLTLVFGLVGEVMHHCRLDLDQCRTGVQLQCRGTAATALPSLNDCGGCSVVNGMVVITKQREDGMCRRGRGVWRQVTRGCCVVGGDDK